ncbi:MAG: hypothetical protein J6Z31_01685 [Fibrobacter sp.]|nr:hypothetical protein [Fibrobacter sp.]
MKRSAWTWMLLGTLGACVLSACSGDSTAGRGIWDETENGLAVTIRGQEGSPIASAKVRLVSATAVVQDSALSNSEGIARFEKRPDYAGHVEVSASEGVARSAFASGDSAVSEVLSAPARLSGSLNLTNGEIPSEFYLYGTSYKASIAADGSFSFENVPAGDYAILSAGETSYLYWNESKLVPNEETVVSLNVPSKDSVLIDDFEDGRGTNLFYALTGGGWWFTYGDSTSTISPRLPERGLSREDAYAGSQSLHETFVIDSTAKNPYALVGFNIGTAPSDDSLRGYDLSKLDSVTVYVKGFGHVFMQFAGLDDALNSVNWEFEFDIPSNEEWTRVSAVPGDDALWMQIAANMKTINFLVTESADIWLDQIVFHGVSASDVFRVELEK